jgi:hypothetical protein
MSRLLLQFFAPCRECALPCGLGKNQFPAEDESGCFGTLMDQDVVQTRKQAGGASTEIAARDTKK